MPELELSLLAGSTLVARGPTNIGVYALGGATEGRAALIDSGNDGDAGKRIIRACAASGLTIALIANTHSNADHCGANALVQARTGCAIAAPRTELSFIEHPELEPSLVWGAYPPAPLRNKFLMANASRVTLPLDDPCLVGDTGIEAISLPGHYLGQVGYLTPDRVFFAADAAASPAILAKYKYYVVYDVASHLATLDKIAGLAFDWIVPSHGEPAREAGPLIEANKATILEVGDRIRELCSSLSAGPLTPEGLVSALASALGLELNHTQYALLGMTVRSYIAWLCDRGEATTRMEGNRLLVESI
jgi:glyoxylase-like metal-dependent hydrolase (beta-lactamase superfamily II)